MLQSSVAVQTIGSTPRTREWPLLTTVCRQVDEEAARLLAERARHAERASASAAIEIDTLRSQLAVSLRAPAETELRAALDSARTEKARATAHATRLTVEMQSLREQVLQAERRAEVVLADAAADKAVQNSLLEKLCAPVRFHEGRLTRGVASAAEVPTQSHR